MKGLKKKIMAVALILTLAVSGTVLAATGQPKGEIDYRTKVFDEVTIYGDYMMVDPVTGYTLTLDIGIYTDGPIEYYARLEAFQDGSTVPSVSYLGNMVNYRGNVYEAIEGIYWDEALPYFEIVFNPDASQVSIKASPAYIMQGYGIFDGIYDLVERPDLSHAG